ncbi:hypothetical protein LJR290_007678 [Variovorax sp. LjRoot290]|uniref:hypothetical protein n=1 Tax=Variovorax sp. LjRoot290 TaxID=3342316 RepID=UPI003ED0A856
MKLSKTQQELFDAMKAGVVVHMAWTRATGGYYFRADNMKNCTAAALALSKKGFAKNEGRFEDKVLVLTGTEPTE